MAKRTKTKQFLMFLPLIVGLGMVLLFALLLRGHDVPVLNPQGTIGAQQRDLIILTTALGMIVVVPVFALTFGIVWRYREREGDHRAAYKPNWGHSKLAETVWWGIPIALILVLSVIIWNTSHALDPYKPIASTKKPVTIQVIALQWKWLFIYPEQKIATVNYVQFPEDTPVHFVITADAPMNSFWIPSLGGQVYAMSGMQTKLHLMADSVGSYNGSSANLSGEGFADMKFVAESTTKKAFDDWVQAMQHSESRLTTTVYDDLVLPSKDNPETHYVVADSGIFDATIMKYMMPGHQTSNKDHTNTENEEGHAH